MVSTDVDVLIVGAGPTGLTLACELARSRISFEIVEASPAPQRGSRGKGIQPRTLEVFDDLGIVETALARGRIAMPIRSVDAHGAETRSGGGAPEVRPDTPYTASLLTPQWRIEEALRERLAKSGGGVGFGVELAGFEQSDPGVTSTVIEAGGHRTITSRWLVGCDGGHSIVRKLSGIAFLGETLEAVRMIVADVCADGADRECWQMWRSAEGFAALCPLPSTDAFQLQASIAPGQDPDLSLANMQSILERRSGRSDIRLRGIDWSSLWRANVRMVDRYRSGRVFLAGDAAHIHSPAGGQGMNTGIQDAHNLGWKLATVVRGGAAGLLDTYQEERLPVAAGVLSLSNELLRASMAERGISLARDGRTTQLGLSYRTLSLASDDRGDDAPIRAGDRAPDAPGLLTPAGERRLFDLMRGGHFTLLHFGGSPRHLPDHAALCVQRFQVAAELSGPDRVVDVDGHLKQALGAGDATQVLIRPDGYIGAITDTEQSTGCADYLARLAGHV